MLYIHIGSQKTGTTAIQGLLNANSQLLRQAGFHYIKAGRNHIAHNDLNMRLKRGNGKTVCDAVVAEIGTSPVDNHIISSELFFRPGAASAFRQFLPKSIIRKTKVICYIRRQDKYLEAMYKQLVKNNRIAPDPQAFFLSRRDGLAYSKVLNAYADVFGQKNVIVRTFERQNFPDGSVTNDFAEILGLNITKRFQLSDATSNKSLSVAVSEMLGAINRNTVFNSREIIREIIRITPHGAIRSNDVFDKKVRRALIEQHAEDNEMVRIKFCVDRQELFYLDDIGVDSPDPFPNLNSQLLHSKQAIEAVLQAIGNIEAAKKSRNIP